MFLNNAGDRSRFVNRSPLSETCQSLLLVHIRIRIDLKLDCDCLRGKKSMLSKSMASASERNVRRIKMIIYMSHIQACSIDCDAVTRPSQLNRG